ncbi:hypothetical protein [Lactiplantibacillus mudanjiangensis]|uniref:Uncharacterized protein n=1 Tax=Lactiplantibacillus mudanjiangensis TaxID=1296538 RepID=A0A660E4C3_9LACO|nr:hypothetical protein [Lactiplantibacillus mudanjiangensis]VDG23649.1 hypothetical protein [Lactobacillus plantarum subsp. plantarum] [Lactiplantibacillus mudanjiangensis]VDG27792.1 hypothetical protein [Lactobacillus plantarum subsp. plantarum] [Lactiplantibacillus mudanjiangensis]
MLDFQIIDAGEADWGAKINSNFGKISADTGWINAPIVAPCTGTVYYRVLNERILLIRGSVAPNQTITTDLKFTDLPANIVSLKSATPNGLWLAPVTGSAAADVAKIVLHPDFGLYFAGNSGSSGHPVLINIAVID